MGLLLGLEVGLSDGALLGLLVGWLALLVGEAVLGAYLCVFIKIDTSKTICEC